MKIYKNCELDVGMEVKLRFFKTCEEAHQFSLNNGGMEEDVLDSMKEHFGKIVTITELNKYGDTDTFRLGDYYNCIYDTCWVEKVVTGEVAVKVNSPSCPHSDIRKVYVGEWIDVCHNCKEEIK